jgi:replicative DNA helicase
MISESDKKNIAKEALGCLLKSEKAIYKCFELGLSEACFADEDAKMLLLYKAIIKLFKETGTLPSLEALIRELTSDKEQAHIYRGLIKTCRNLAENPMLIDKFIEQLEDYRASRDFSNRLLASAEKYKKGEFKDSNEMLNFVSGKLLQLQAAKRGKRVYGTYESCELTVHRLKHDHKLPISTGFTEMDGPLFGGFFPGGLVTVAGRPGQGKTTVLMQLGVNSAKAGYVTLFLSAELGIKELNYKQLSLVSSVSYSRMFRGFNKTKEGFLNDTDMEQLKKATQIYENLPLKLGNICGCDIDTVCNLIHEQVKIHGVQIVFLDYFQLINLPSKNGARRPNTPSEFAEICGKLRQLAVMLDTPIVMGAQLNRECERRKGREKKPRLSDLKATGSLEEDSYLVMGLFREEYYLKEKSEKKGIIEIEILKNRYGDCPNLEFAFLGKRGAIRSIPKDVQKEHTVNEDGELEESVQNCTTEGKDDETT